MDTHMPLGRPNNTPENPMDDMDAPLVPMNTDGAYNSLTDASVKGSFQSRDQAQEEANVEGPEGSAGPSGKLTPPGGSPMIPMDGYVAQGDKMQFSKEGDRSYSGAAVYSKVIKGGSNTETV